MRNSGSTVIYFQEVSESLLQKMNNTMYDYSLLMLAHRFRTNSFSVLVERNYSLRVKKATRCFWMRILTATVLAPIINKGVPLIIILPHKSHSQTASFGIAKWLRFTVGMYSPHCCNMSWHCSRYIPFFWHSSSTEASKDNSWLMYLFTWG